MTEKIAAWCLRRCFLRVAHLSEPDRSIALRRFRANLGPKTILSFIAAFASLILGGLMVFAYCWYPPEPNLFPISVLIFYVLFSLAFTALFIFFGRIGKAMHRLLSLEMNPTRDSAD